MQLALQDLVVVVLYDFLRDSRRGCCMLDCSDASFIANIGFILHELNRVIAIAPNRIFLLQLSGLQLGYLGSLLRSLVLYCYTIALTELVCATQLKAIIRAVSRRESREPLVGHNLGLLLFQDFGC